MYSQNTSPDSEVCRDKVPAASLFTFLMLMLLALWPLHTHAQLQQEWFARGDELPAGTNFQIALALDPSGSAYVAAPAYALLKYDTNGTLVWSNYNGGSYKPFDLKVDASGSAFIAGTPLYEAHLRQYTPDGELLEYPFHGRYWSGTTTAHLLELDTNGFAYVVGTRDPGFLALKFEVTNQFGWADPVWSVVATGAPFATATPMATALDANGNLFITGRLGSYYPVRMLTTKISPNGVVLWTKMYGSGTMNIFRGEALAPTADGGVIVAGGREAGELVIVRYDSLGNEVWAREFLTLTNVSVGVQYPGPVQVAGIKLDSKGDVVVAATGFNDYNRTDILTLKVSSAGALLWQNRFGGYNANAAAGVVLDSAGKIHVAGHAAGSTIFGTQGLNYVVATYEPNGVRVGAAMFNGAASSNDVARAVAISRHDEIYVTGSSETTNGTKEIATVKFVVAPSNDAPRFLSLPAATNVVAGSNVTLSVTATGAQPLRYYWRLNGSLPFIGAPNSNVFSFNAFFYGFEGSYSVMVSNAFGITVSPDAYVALNYLSSEPENQDVILGMNAYFGVTPAGPGPFTYQWQFNGIDLSGETNATLIVSNAIPAHAGYYGVVVTSPPGILRSRAARLTVNSQVQVAWASTNLPGAALALDGNGNFYVLSTLTWVTSSNGTSFEDGDIVLSKHAPDGTLLWTNRFNSTVGYFDGLRYNYTNPRRPLAVDSAGNAYVGITSMSTNYDDDFLALKFSPGGNLLWERRYDGISNRAAAAVSAVAIDAGGNFYLTGYSERFATVKYDANGTLQWIATNGIVTWSPQDIAVDGAGSVYVGGHSTFTIRDFEVVKFNSAGIQQWVFTDKQADELAGIALDTATNLFIAGSYYQSATGHDYVTARYRSESGSNVWRRYYKQSGPNSEQAISMIATNGRIYVTGTGGTIAYNVDGTPVWTNSSFTGWRLAVGAAGDVYVLVQLSTKETDADYGVAKLSPAGELLWQARYGTPEFDNIFAFVVSPDGRVIVTGSAGTVIFTENAVPPTGVAIGKVTGTNTVMLSVQGEPGRIYAVQTSTNLSTWSPRTNLFATNGTAAFTDAMPTNRPRTFYRALKQP